MIIAARRLAVVAVVGYAGYLLRGQWHELWHVLATVAWQSSASSMGILVGAGVLNALAWQVIVDDLGRPVGFRRAASVNLVGALAKYVPGQVWSYLLQLELGRRLGIDRARVLTAALVLFGVGVVAALLVGAVAVPVVFVAHPAARWLLASVPLALALLREGVVVAILTIGGLPPTRARLRRRFTRDVRRRRPDQRRLVRRERLAVYRGPAVEFSHR